MNRDLKSNVDAASGLSPAARTATGTGSGVDLRDYDSAMAVFAIGNWTDGTWTPSLQESDDDTTYAAVAAADLQGTFTAISGTAGEYTVQRVGYIGAKRYVRPMLSGTGTTGIDASAVIMRGHPRRAPLA